MNYSDNAEANAAEYLAVKASSFRKAINRISGEIGCVEETLGNLRADKAWLERAAANFDAVAASLEGDAA